MKRFVFLALPIFLASPALAADLDYPRAERDVYIEKRTRVIERPPVVIERPARVIVERRYVPVPVYEDYDEPVYSYGYRPYRPAFVGYDYWRYPRWRHFHHHHWRRW